MIDFRVSLVSAQSAKRNIHRRTMVATEAVLSEQMKLSYTGILVSDLSSCRSLAVRTFDIEQQTNVQILSHDRDRQIVVIRCVPLGSSAAPYRGKSRALLHRSMNDWFELQVHCRQARLSTCLASCNHLSPPRNNETHHRKSQLETIDAAKRKAQTRFEATTLSRLCAHIADRTRESSEHL